MVPHTFETNGEDIGDDALVRDPAASPADLHRLAAERPDLRPLIAVHPNVYPELREWIKAVDEPASDAPLTEARAADKEPTARREHPDSAHADSQGGPADEGAATSRIDVDAAILADPDASASELHRIAGERPDLRAAIAAHGNAYPDLLRWLATWDDPEIVAALAARDKGDKRDNAVDRTAVLGGGAAVVPATDTLAAAGPYGSGPFIAEHSAPRNFEPVGRAERYLSAHVDAGDVSADYHRRSGSVASSIVLGALAGLVVILLAIVLMLWRPWDSGDPKSGTGAAPTKTAQETATPSQSPSPSPSESASSNPSESASPSPTESSQMPFLPTDVPTVSAFSAPSGNIACRSDGERSFTCTIYEHSIKDLGPEKLTCDGPMTVSWREASEPHMSCGATVAKGGSTLEYGARTLLGDGVACSSSQSGISCWDGKSGHGVEIARRGITQVTRAD